MAEQVLLRRMTLLNYAQTGEVRDGGLYIHEAGTDGYNGRLTASSTLEPGPDGVAELTMAIHGEDLILNLGDQSDEYKNGLPAFNVDVELEAAGLNLRDAASALNGDIRIHSTGGQVKNIQSESASTLFLSEVISAISPSSANQETINISCFAAIIDVRDGEVLLDPGIALQSDKLNVFASGKVDLASEKLDVNFRTETRKAVALSASELVSPYVKLTGTLAEPSIALDPAGTLLSGGAAFLSGGLSILAKKALDQIGGNEDPCAKYLAAGEEEEE